MRTSVSIMKKIIINVRGKVGVSETQPEKQGEGKLYVKLV